MSSSLRKAPGTECIYGEIIDLNTSRRHVQCPVEIFDGFYGDFGRNGGFLDMEKLEHSEKVVVSISKIEMDAIIYSFSKSEIQQELPSLIT